MVVGKKKVSPSLVNVAFSAKRLSKLSVTEARAKPVFSTLPRASTSAIATANAAADAKHEASVHRSYDTIGLNDVARISALIFPASLNKAAGALQLTRSVKAAMSDILMRSDDRCAEGLRSPTCVPGWDLSLQKAFMRAITPTKPTTADMTTLLDDLFGQVLRAVKGG